MLFSVLIAHYNNSRFLNRAIHSVMDQTHKDWEIVLVDDGSTDDFEEVIKSFMNDHRIKIHRNEQNFGCGYSKRRCAEKGKGAVMGFLDPDDALTPDALETMIKMHKENEKCSLIHSSHYVCDEKLNINRIADYTGPLPANTPYLLVGDGRIHHFVTFRKAAYDRTEGISSEIKAAVDQDLYYRLEEEGDVAFINQPLYYYRIHEAAISNGGKGREAAMIHYGIIKAACKRRINQLKQYPGSRQAYLIKQYRARFYKISVFQSFRNKNWLPFASALIIYPFVGGWKNMISYLRKLPKEGSSQIRRTLVENREIQV